MKCPICKQVGEFAGFFMNEFGNVGVHYYCPNCVGRYFKVPVPILTSSGRKIKSVAHATIKR